MSRYIIGTVTLGAALVGGGGLAHAEEVPVLPESEAVVAEAAAEAVETPQVVEETPVVEEKTEEVPVLYTAAGVEEEDTLVEEDVPVITDSASDGVNESGFEITEAHGRILTHARESSLNYDLLEYTVSMKIPSSYVPGKEISVYISQDTEHGGPKTNIVLLNTFNDEAKDILLDGTVVGQYRRGSIQFNESITNYIDRSVSFTLRRGIKKVSVPSGETGGLVSLPIDLYLNSKFATRMMVERLTGPVNTERRRSLVASGDLDVSTFTLDNDVTLPYDGVDPDEPIKLRLTVPEGFKFSDSLTARRLSKVNFKKDNTLTGYAPYSLTRQVNDYFDVVSFEKTDRQLDLTLDWKTPEGSRAEFFNNAQLGNILVDVVDYSKINFKEDAKGNKYITLAEPIRVEPLNGNYVPGRAQGVDGYRNSFEISEYYVPSDAIITADGKIVSYRTDVTTREIPYETEERKNPSLKAGERKVVQAGVNGEERVSVKIRYENGVEVSRDDATTEITRKPVNEIVEIGTAKVETRTYTETIDEIPYKTEERVNPDLPEGERKVVQKGVNGKTVVTLEVNTLNGEDQGEPREVSREVIDPVNEIVEVGSKVETESIPFKSEERENPELPEGERTIVQEGKNGLKNATTGEVIEEPVNEIIEVGTKVVTEEIAFETEERENADLPKGERKVIREGKVGLKNAKTGEVIKAPVNEIIEIGTKVVTEEIAFETEERTNPKLPEGERKVIQEGKVGRKNAHTGEIIDEPVNEIVEVGTGKVSDLTPLEPAEEVIEAAELVPAEKAEDAAELTPAEKAEDAAELTPVEKAEDAAELLPAEKAEDAAELTPAEKAEDAAELVPAEKAEDAAELTPAEEAMDAAELEPAILEAPEVIENVPEIVESQPEVVPLSVAQLPETGEDDDFVVLGLASLGLLAGIGLVNDRKEEM